MKSTTNLHLLKKGHPFTWGRVITIHVLGIYNIVEYHPRKSDSMAIDKDTVEYHGYVLGNDTSQSYGSIEEAIAGCIAYRFEGPNHHADHYFMKMIGDKPYEN